MQPPGTFGPEYDSSPSDVLAQLLRMLAILRRRWLVVLVTTVLCVAAAALAVQMLPPRWRASASIVLHMSGSQVFDKVKGVIDDAEGRTARYSEYYQTQRTIMQSRAVAERALAELGLADDPEFLGIANESEANRAEAAAKIDPVERLRELVTVEEIRNSRVVQISAEYPSPELARDIANAVADAYVEHVRNSRSRLGTEAKDNIASERDKALEQLRKAEHELEAFKTDNSITSISLSDRQNVITQGILTLSTRAKEAEAERIRLERTLAQAQALHQKGNLSAATLIPEETRAVFAEMRKEQLVAEAEFGNVDIEYGEKHEQHRKAASRLKLVNQAISREASELIESLASRLAAAQAVEQDLLRSMNRENDKALELGKLERRYRELEREATVAAEDYVLVARRDTEIAITNRVEDEGIEILDRATAPTEPAFPPKLLLLELSIVAGLGFGALLAISIDFRDQRIRGLVDLERALGNFGAPVLGQVPLLPPDSRLGVGNARAQRRQRDLYAHLFPQSLMAERCRGIRTSIAFVQGSEPAKTIMISSPQSSEGKSSTAMNLALSFCQSGKSVLVIDADMRRPRLHQVFSSPLPNEYVGLAAVLAGQAMVEQAIVRAPEDAPEKLWLLPCGRVPETPAELLDGPALRRLLADLSERFDVVILDTPPVLPVADALILAGRVDGVVLVARCDQTTRGDLQRALSSLAQADANLLGIVLNEVDTRRERYDYSGGYYTYRARDTGTDAGRHEEA